MLVTRAWSGLLGSVPGVSGTEAPRRPRRGESVGVRLIRHGFTDPDTAEQLLTGLDGGAEEAVLVALSDTADPDLALSALSRIVAALAPADRALLLDALGADDALRRRLLGILGVSAARRASGPPPGGLAACRSRTVGAENGAEGRDVACRTFRARHAAGGLPARPAWHRRRRSRWRDVDGTDRGAAVRSRRRDAPGGTRHGGRRARR